jgi:hypothetical protein
MPPRHLRRARVLLGGLTVAILAALVAPHAGLAATFYVSPSGSGGACSAAAPCGSFDVAYDRARPGDRIEAAGGTYGGSERITGDKGSRTRIVIESAGGASVTVTGSFSVLADRVTVRDIRAADGWGIDNSTPGNPIYGVRLENVSGRNVFIQNARGPVVTGSDFGPFPNHETGLVGTWPVSYNVTFSNNRFHDTRPTTDSAHVECIEANNVRGLKVLNNRFERCGYFGILPGRLFARPNPSSLRLIGNEFGRTYNCSRASCTSEGDWGIAPYSIMFGADRWEGTSVIRDNYFETPPGGLDRVRFARLIAYGNTGAAPARWKRLLSTTTAAVLKVARAIRVTGTLLPPHPGARIVVSLYRRRDGSFVRIAVHGPRLSEASAYRTFFARPRRGICNVTARFAGNARFIPSSRSVRFAC